MYYYQVSDKIFFSSICNTLILFFLYNLTLYCCACNELECLCIIYELNLKQLKNLKHPNLFVFACYICLFDTSKRKFNLDIKLYSWADE